MGSNLGDRAAMLARAEEAMNAAGVRVVRRSSLYMTEPVDAPPPWFLNAVVEAETSLMPVQLLHVLARIERGLGRRRQVRRIMLPGLPADNGCNLESNSQHAGACRATAAPVPRRGQPAGRADRRGGRR